MSGALALASITAILKNLLENELIDRGVTSSLGSEPVVSALPPDRVATGEDERTQINLFLYQVTPSTGLRSAGRLMAADAGERRGAATGLALDLHYLLTAYGAQDFQIEILLGHALQLFHRMPTLPRETLRATLRALSSDDGQVRPPTLAALATSRLAEQVEQISISPQFMHAEEMAKLWSAIQGRYRPSVAYRVSVVLLGEQG